MLFVDLVFHEFVNRMSPQGQVGREELFPCKQRQTYDCACRLRRSATSSGVTKMISFATAISCRAMLISSCLVRFDPLTGMMTNRSLSLFGPAISRACEPNRII